MTPSTFLYHAHSGWRYIVLALLIIACIRLLVGWLGKLSWSKYDRWLIAGTAGSVHLQALMGIVLYILLQSWLTQGVTLWHSVPGLIAVYLVAKGSGWSKRKETPIEKFKWAFIAMSSTLVLVSFSVLYITSR